MGLLCVMFGCGSDSNGVAKPKDTDGGAGTGGTASGGSGGSGADGGIQVDGSADAGTFGCSSDLRSIVDDAGTVVTTCPVDQGCSAGACVPACQAAADSRGNVGCDFRVPTPPAYQTTKPPCFALALANTWPRPAKISLSRGGATFDVTQVARIVEDGKPPEQWSPVPTAGVPVDEVAVVFLSSDPTSIFPENNVPMTCPITPAVNAATMVDGSGVGEAFHVTSDTPLSAYDIIPFGGARSHFPSASLLFPTTAWGTNYVVIATPPGTHSPPGPLWGQILAQQDGTTVQLLPTADLPAMASSPATPQNTPLTLTLNAGDYAQWQLAAGQSDLSGSVVLADKPVAVFAGNRFYRQQPTPGPGGESTHQQVQAVSALGSEYVGAPFATRRKDGVDEPIRYRLVGTVAGTTLSFDPPVSGAPTTLGAGEVADMLATGAFRVASQGPSHPFAMAQMMDTANVPGGSVPGASAAYCASFNLTPELGDEEFVVLHPPAQFLSKYVFFTDPTYNTTHLVITRRATAQGFADVSVGCLGTVGGWKPVGTSGQYEVATLDLVRDGVGVSGCSNGRHVAQSAGPFGVLVWGLDCYASYGYPAGGNAATLSTVTVPPVPR